MRGVISSMHAPVFESAMVFSSMILRLYAYVYAGDGIERSCKLASWHLSLAFDEYLHGRYFFNLGPGLYCRNGMNVAPGFQEFAKVQGM